MTLAEQIEFFSLIVKTGDSLNQESEAMNRAVLATLQRYSYLRLIARPISARPDIFSGPIVLNVVSPIYSPDTWGNSFDAAIDAARSLS